MRDFEWEKMRMVENEERENIGMGLFAYDNFCSSRILNLEKPRANIQQ